MVRARALRSAAGPFAGPGPCDNKLANLGRGVEAVLAAGKAVLLLSEVASKYRVARDLLGYSDAGGCCRWGKGCDGRCRKRVLQWQKWSTSIDVLHKVTLQEVEQSLDSLPLPRGVVGRVNGSSPENFTGGSTEYPLTQLLSETRRKWRALQHQKSALLEAREAAKHASQSMRAWLKHQEGSLAEGCDANKEAPPKVVHHLHTASRAERIQEECIQSAADDLATHLVKTHRELKARLARVAQDRDSAVRDARRFPLDGSLLQPTTSVEAEPVKIALAGLRLDAAKNQKLCDIVISRETCPEGLPTVQRDDENDWVGGTVPSESMEAAMDAALVVSKELVRQVSSSAHTECSLDQGFADADADTDVDTDALLPQGSPAGLSFGKEHDERVLLSAVMGAASPSRRRT